MTSINIGVEDVAIEVVAVGEKGMTGPEGPTGPRGEKGDPGSSYVHVHHQALLSSLWDIQHNLNKHPAVFVEDGGGTQIYGSITYIDDNRLTIEFTFSATGRANCS